MSEREWVGMGDHVEVTGARQQAAMAEFDRRYAYAVKSETHLWIVTLCHYAADTTLDAFAGASDALPMLDAETLAMSPAVGCYVCEEPYDRRSCKHRSCVNPEHQEPVEPLVNYQRGRAYQANTGKTRCPQGHDYSGWNVITYRGRRYCRACMYARRAAARAS